MKRYTEDDYTDWFPGHIKPVRDGVYERDYGDDGKDVVLCRFSKGNWYSLAATVEEASRITTESVFQDKPWRGLKREPK